MASSLLWELFSIIVFDYACIQFILAIYLIQWYTWILETHFKLFLTIVNVDIPIQCLRFFVSQEDIDVLRSIMRLKNRQKIEKRRRYEW